MIFDPIQNEPKFIEKLLKHFKKHVQARGVSILPKIIQLSTVPSKRNISKNDRNKAEVNALLSSESLVDYEVSKPLRKQDFVRIFHKFKYPYHK